MGSAGIVRELGACDYSWGRANIETTITLDSK